MRQHAGGCVVQEIESENVVMGAIGEPGRRVFYVQIHDADRLVTLPAEKEQIVVLAERAIEALDTIADDVGADPVEPAPALALKPPDTTEFAIGAIGIGFDEDRDKMLVQFEELLPAETDGDAEPDTIRVFISRPRLRSVARHAIEVAKAGRPACALCGLPEDAGHVCPRGNGHRG